MTARDKMNVAFEALGISTVTHFDQDKETTRRELSCMLFVAHSPLRPRPFDSARLTLLGQLKSNINGVRSNKPVSAARVTKFWLAGSALIIS